MHEITSIWPGYIKPENGELFSSWYFRLCDQHKIKSHSFAKFYLDSASIWNRDIDQSCPKSIRDKIKKFTPLNHSEIDNLFLDSYRGFLFNENNKAKTILDLGIYHRKRKGFGLLFCPGCLDNEIVYFKKNWRLSTSLVCETCSLMLVDRCQTCFSPICFHRLETGYKGSLLNYRLSVCWNCKIDLRKNSFINASNDHIECQKYIDRSICNGFNDKTSYSFLYFDVLTTINSKIFTKSNYWNRVKLGFEKEFGFYFPHDLSEKNNVEIRKKTYLLCFQLLDSWPQTFMLFCNKYNIRLSDFSRDMDSVPFWFESGFRLHT